MLLTLKIPKVHYNVSFPGKNYVRYRTVAGRNLKLSVTSLQVVNISTKVIIERMLY
jgi:hypothetical protein